MSTGRELLTQLETQINVETTDASTSPSQETLIKYLNRAQRKLAGEMKPDELKSGPVDVATIEDTNTATKPTTLLTIDSLYLSDGGKYKELEKKSIPTILNPSVLYQQYVGSPNYYEIRGSLIYFDKYFESSNSDGLKAYGILIPTVIDSDDLSIEIDFQTEYDDVIVYLAATYHFANDFDINMLSVTNQLMRDEKSRIKTFFGTNLQGSISLDPRFWNHRRV